MLLTVLAGLILLLLFVSFYIYMYIKASFLKYAEFG